MRIPRGTVQWLFTLHLATVLRALLLKLLTGLRGNEAKSHTGEVSTEANYQKYKISKMLLYDYIK